jgi:pseudouridine synthase
MKMIMMKMRINKFLSRCGVASRRKSEEILKKGIVSVNGEIILEPYHIVDTDKDIVRVNNNIVSIHPEVYIIMNKPENTVSTTSDKWGRKTVVDLLHNENIIDENIIDGIFPVGRLDMDTTGLLLLTNDGDICNRIIHPSQNITKKYIMKLSRELTNAEFQKIINSKIYIDGRRVKVESLKSTQKYYYKIVIT